MRDDLDVWIDDTHHVAHRLSRLAGQYTGCPANPLKVGRLGISGVGIAFLVGNITEIRSILTNFVLDPERGRLAGGTLVDKGDHALIQAPEGTGATP